MNKLTRKIRNKGYTLDEFLKRIGFSLRWYRTHSHEGAPRYEFLKTQVERIEKAEIK